MHFDILVEDISGKIAIEILIPKIIDTERHTFTIHSYKGIGHIPKDLKSTSDPQKRILLSQLPKLVQGFGKTYAGYNNYIGVLIIVCDLDDRCLKEFRRELLDFVDKCNPRPETYFCLAIEEGEAWFLGDFEAVRVAYPDMLEAVLATYTNDEICGTWEKLADAVFPGGSKVLALGGYSAVGKEKAAWAKNIPPHMDVDNNLSPSFCYFRGKLRSLSSR